MGRFDGKVVVITGAGGGIGREYARSFAKEGAQVVVNDLGGTVDGSGKDSKMADQVVAEIVAAGGKAVAHVESVATMEGAQSLVQTAVSSYGKIDILINNAGILRDKTLLKMEESMWDAVIAVHLKGTFACTQVAAKRMVEQGEGGRIINTSSYSGLIGNFGQSNYAAAKAGIYGLTVCAALELKKKGITVNAIAPMAKTRMTDKISAVPDEMRPEMVAPVALYLASDLAKDITGQVIGVHGQQLLGYKMKTNDGVSKEGDVLWSVDEIDGKIGEILNFEAKAAPQGDAPLPEDPIKRAFALMPKAFNAEKAKNKSFNIYWAIEDGVDHTLKLADGKLSVAEGKQGDPTCTVNVKVAILGGMFTGKVRPEQAFMTGKLRASNLGDMMTFGQVIDLKKAQAISLKEQTKSAAASAPQKESDATAGGDPLAQAFALLPQAFAPEKAKGKAFNIFWDIEGGSKHSIILVDDALKVVPGKSGTPTCTVAASAETVIGIFTGKVKAEQAFMTGKVKASNLGDMMTFGKVIDMKKAKAVAERARAEAKASPAPAADPIASAFALIPHAFAPEKAKDKAFNIFWNIEGGTDHSIILAEGAITVAQGKSGNPTCTVSASAETVIGIFTGKIKAEQAFMTGKVKASNLGDMMTFGKVIDMKKAKAVAEKARAEAKASPAPAADPIASAFALIPHAFAADKAKGKTFNIFWNIEGGTDHSIILADDALRVVKGKEGEPSCTVNASAETVVGIFSGKVKAEQAFMTGKVKATNLGDMMTFGKVIDMKKAKAVAEEARAKGPSAPKANKAAPAPVGGSALDHSFQHLVSSFKADQAGNWSAVIFFDIKDCEGYTVAIKDGAATASAGKSETPSVTVTIADTEAALGIVTGSLDAQKAFMKGKIVASNIGALMKFTQCFTFEAPPAPVAAAPSGPDRKKLIGKVYEGSLHMVESKHMLAYAEACGEDNPAYLNEESGIVGHPILPVRYSIDAMKQVMMDDELELDHLRLVHAEQDMRFYEPIVPGMLLNVRSVLKGAEEKESGTLVNTNIYAYADGRKVFEADTSFFVRSRGRNKLAPPRKKSSKKAAAPERGEIVIRHSMTVTEDQPKRYAAASLDNNPIHLDNDVATSAGLPGVILHGLCTMAISTKGLVDQGAKGDPTRLKRYSVRFTKMVLPGNTLITEAWIVDENDESTTYAFDVKNEDDVVVVSRGVAEISKI